MGRDTVAARRKARQAQRAKSSQRSVNEEIGCWFGFLSWLVYGIHFTDFFLGLGVLIYGFMISASVSAGMETLPIFFIAGGSLLITSSVFGVLGKKTDMCKRVGLLISSYLAVPIAIAEVAIGFVVVIAESSIQDFLKDNKDDFYMTDSSIKAFGNSVGVIFVVCIACAFVEFCRFYMLRKIRDDLLDYDAIQYESNLSEALNPNGDTPDEDRNERKKSSKNKKSAPAKKKWGFGRNKNKKVNPNSKQESKKAAIMDPYEDKSEKTNLTDSTGFNPVDESLHTDSLWWAKSNTLDDDKDMTWLNEV